MVGDFKGIMIPQLGAVRGTGGRLKGLRLVHTHLAGEEISDEDLMDLLFLRLDLLSLLTITEDGLPDRLFSAHLLPAAREEKHWAFLLRCIRQTRPIPLLILLPPLRASSLVAKSRQMWTRGKIGRSW